jgi:hypothetical protein
MVGNFGIPKRHFFPSPSAHGISISAEKSYKLNSVAPPATILNDVPTFSVGGAFLNLHCLFAYNAAQETYQRAFIVVQMISPRLFVQASFPLRLRQIDPVLPKF